MRLNAELLRYMTKEEFRVLTAVEMGHKNHEFVPMPLVQSIASLKRRSVQDVIPLLLKNKLLYRTNQTYESVKLTYLGYDYLALHAFVKRGVLSSVGRRIGVGKESDIHLCQTSDGKVAVLKLHRLGRSSFPYGHLDAIYAMYTDRSNVYAKAFPAAMGRISFRSIKRNRDYLQRRQHASWMYLARLAALKEFFYLKTLHAHGFPVPEPIDVNRHAVLMEYIDATPFREVKELPNPMRILEKLMRLIVRLGRAGLIHGDFNEFNLLIDAKEHITFIDLPQVVSTQHPNAEMYFQRDVECIRSLFARKFNVEVTEAPQFQDVCQRRSSTGDGNPRAAIKKPGSSDVKGLERSLRVEEVLEAEELCAVDEALTELRRRRMGGLADLNDNASCSESRSETDLDPNGDSDDADSKAFASSGAKCKRRDAETETLSEDFATEGHESDHDSDTSPKDDADENCNSLIYSYNPQARKHDPKVVRKRVQQSEKKKLNRMGNSGRNKNRDRIRVRREIARYQ